MSMPNQVQLITYANSMGGDLQGLHRALEHHFPGMFAGIHILPPYPSSGDRGFAPIDYREIDPAFGTWQDVEALAQKHRLTLDVMVNHISRRSAQFQDFLKNAEGSPYAGFFLTPQKIWGADEPPAEDLEKIVLRRERPWSEYVTEGGKTVRMWTTFGGVDPSEQIDLDVNDPGVREYFAELFRFFSERNITMLRLDAVGYVTKKPGTSCFFVEPEIYDFLKWARRATAEVGIELLCEVHAEIAVQNRLAGHGFWIYDFLMPYTVLQTLIFKDGELLYKILENRPENQITMLDCHDGIPVQPDMDGWVTAEQVRQVVDICAARGARFTRLQSAEHKNTDFPDVHQICGTYYSLLGEDDDAYIAARAIQFFVPGVPQVYYVGLLAGENDTCQWQAEKDDRELNRHNYTPGEVALAREKPVVQRLVQLIHLRNNHPAFGGGFTALPAGQGQIALQWEKEDAVLRLDIDLGQMKAVVSDSLSGKQVAL